MTRRNRFLIIFIVLATVGYFGYNYLYKDHRDIASENSSLEITATYLLERFKKGDSEELLNRTITVTGTISQLDLGAVTIDEYVHCVFSETITGLAEDQTIKIKGRCIGYDDLFEVVKLDQCSIIQ